MESERARPKIANSSRKLPEDFISSRTMGVIGPKKSHGSKQQSHHAHSQSSQPSKKPEEQTQKQKMKKKKNKNPFLPVRECIKMIKAFEDGLQSLQKHQNILSHKYPKLDMEKNQHRQSGHESQFSFESNYSSKKSRNSESSIKYENCLTLAILKKHQKGCLKKVLFVPRLSMHYLRESIISNDMDKKELHDWIKEVNANTGNYGLKIIELFWNIPEGYYSIMYEYFEGSTFADLIEEFYSLPLSTLKLLAKSHLDSHPAIYSSEILIGSEIRHNQNPKLTVKYLPFFEQEQIPGGSVLKRLQEHMEEKQEECSQKVKADNVLVGRLGIMIMLGFFGEVLMDEDYNQLRLRQSKTDSCCFLHGLLSIPNALTKNYINDHTQNNDLPNFIDFLCALLKYCSEKQIAMNSIVNTQFIKQQKDAEFPTFEQIQRALDFNPQADNMDKTINISNNKQLAQILDAIQLILQNISSREVEIDLNQANQEVQCLARELGLQHATRQLIQELKEVYKGWIKS